MPSIQHKILKEAYRPARAASILALSITLFMITIKFIGWSLSASTILFASLIDSLTDFVISTLNFFAIRHAQKPADINHRYGHGKIEGIASIFQGALIAAAAFFILLEGLQRLVDPVTIKQPMIAVTVTIIAIIATLILVVVQRASLRKAYSLAIDADYAHYSGDIAMNLGILIVLGAGYFGAPPWLDPLGAICVTAYMGLSAWHIAKKGFDMLLDREVGGDSRERILQKVLSHAGIHGLHDLRTRYHGNRMSISFDVEMQPDLKLCEAHAIVKDLEESLLIDFPGAEIMIHKDPIGDTEDSRHRVKGVHIS